MPDINKDEIIRLTEEYGGPWGVNHTRRLLHLIAVIGEGQQYNHDAVWVAAHLHDWGAYAPWAQEGVDHAQRSTHVAQTFLKERNYPTDLTELILECIGSHHSGDPNRSIEAILLSDADALDFLGVVGVLRDFSKNPKDMRKAYKITRQRREQVPGLIVLDKSKEIAAERIKQMEALYSAFEENTSGYF